MSSGKAADDPRLQQLVEGIVRLAAGELDTRMKTSEHRDDIDAVITGVNLLAEELDHIYSDLELRVADRTAMLERAQAVFRDEEKLIAMSKSARAELDSILQGDAAADGRSDRQAPEQQDSVNGAPRAS